MDVVGRINILIWAGAQSLRSAKRISIFLPFFLFALLQGIVLIVLILFYLPPFSRILVPLMVRLYDEVVLHYPHSYAVLPFLFFGANRWLNLLVSWLLIGAATLMFAAHYRGQRPRPGKSFGRALRYAWPLFIVGAVEWVVMFGLGRLIRLSTPEVLLWSAHFTRLFRIFGFFLNVAFITPFAFTTLQIVLGGQGIFQALRGSFALAKRNFGVTYLIIAIPALFTWIVDVMTEKTTLAISTFSPEIIVFFLVLGMVVTLVVNFLIVGALTAFYLHATERV